MITKKEKKSLNNFFEESKKLNDVLSSYSEKLDNYIKESLEAHNNANPWKEKLEKKLKDSGLKDESIAKEYFNHEIKVQEDYLKFKFLVQAFKIQNNPKNVITIDKEKVFPNGRREYYIEKSHFVINTLESLVGPNKEAIFYVDPWLSAYLKIGPDYKSSRKMSSGIYLDGELNNDILNNKISIYKVPKELIEPSYVALPEDKIQYLTEEEKYRYKVCYNQDRASFNKIIDRPKNAHDLYEDPKPKKMEYPEPAKYYNQGYLVCDGIIYQVNITGFSRGPWEYLENS